MYTAVLMAALATSTASPAFHHGYGCSCYGGFPYSYNPGCYGCSCYGGFGFAGGAYGYHGGCYGAYGGAYDAGYGTCTGCYGCYGGYSCYGIPVPIAPVAPRPTVLPPARDPFPAINPTPKKDVTPEKDGAEEVGSPKEKPKGTENKKMPDSEKKPDEKKKLSLDSNTPIRARLRIEVPEGGKLFVDDQAINVHAGTRLFQTPPLAPGERYYYDIRIERAAEIRSRRIVIEAGQDVAVSFPTLTPIARVNR